MRQGPEISESKLLAVRGSFMEAEHHLIDLHAKHPVTRLLCADQVVGLEKDGAGVIQTVSICLQNHITRRSIHHLAPITGPDEDARATACVNWK